MTVRFLIENSGGHASDRALVYRAHEHSFDMVPAPSGAFTSVLIDDLNLEIDDSGRLVSVWGMCPETRWAEARLVPPLAKIGSVLVLPERPLTRGVSQQVNSEKYLPTYVDWVSGWVQVKGRPTPASAVKVFPGVIFEISEDGQFSALWLKPQQGVEHGEGA